MATPKSLDLDLWTLSKIQTALESLNNQSAYVQFTGRLDVCDLLVDVEWAGDRDEHLITAMDQR